jgi:nicotinate-nucleotide adenylyltransferase
VTDTSAREQVPAGLAGRVGILGGTFNPPHIGHLAAARHVRQRLDLDVVALMPTSRPPHKQAEEDPGPRHRLEMCRLAIQDTPGILVCALEVERGGASYTVDTLRTMHASHPEAEMTFIVGADIARTLPSWRRSQELLDLARWAVVAREGAPREAILDALRPLGSPDRVSFLDMPEVEVSSSMIRSRVTEHGSIDELVGPKVAAYISEHRLYGAPVDGVSS